MHNSWSFAPSVNRRCFKTSVLRATWRAKFAHVSSSRVFLAHVGFKIRLLRTRTQLGAQLERRRSVGGASVWHLRLTPLFELSKNVGIQNDPDGVRVNISQRLANFKV